MANMPRTLVPLPALAENNPQATPKINNTRHATSEKQQIFIK